MDGGGGDNWSGLISLSSLGYLTFCQQFIITHEYGYTYTINITLLQACNCPNSCDYTTYNMVSTSYSAFPATSVTEQFAAMHNKTREEVSSNYLAMNVYFVNQDTEVEETANSYKFSALLSDIGGLLGLFLGMSVISNARIWYVATGRNQG